MVETPKKTCRIEVQKYSNEKSSILGQVKRGLIFGGRKFMGEIKTHFLRDKNDVELHQHNSLFQTFSSESMLKRASEHRDFDPEGARNAGKIDTAGQDKRDLLWPAGVSKL